MLLNQKISALVSRMTQSPLMRRSLFVVGLVVMVINPFAFICSGEKIIKALEQQEIEYVKELNKVSQDKKAVAKMYLEKIEKKEEDELLKQMDEIK